MTRCHKFCIGKNGASWGTKCVILPNDVVMAQQGLKGSNDSTRVVREIFLSTILSLKTVTLTMHCLMTYQ